MFGVSRSGKTCYLYAMSQVLNYGVDMESTHLSVIANDPMQQSILNNGYLEMVSGVWPEGSIETREFDFNVSIQHEGIYIPLIPSLILHDYRGGVWEGATEANIKEREALLASFADAMCVLFLVDGNTLLHAMDAMDVAPGHRVVSAIDKVRARQQVSFVQNLFLKFKENANGNQLPPILVVITKSDVFSSSYEKRNAYNYIRKTIPSIFAQGSHVDAAITSVSLGDNLTNHNMQLAGDLDISINHNIHIPMVFSLYAYLDSIYDGCPEEEQELIDSLLKSLRDCFADKIELYMNGIPAFAC